MNSYAFGQISPGPLSAAHAGLEGISNCTQCHDLGNKVPDQKCLECHKEINELVKAKKGYHASKDVTSKNCVTCHNDHHGRKFDLIRFEENDFDHLLAGYELKGKHKVIDCRECHKPELISDPKIAKLKDTYLGLKDDCLTCHSDFHQETLSKNCVECHGFDAFRPTVGFNHNDADFKLRGKHTDISCVECHPKTTKNGKEFQQFTGIEFTDCKSCHDNPHSQNIPGSCVQCHVESSFETFKACGVAS